MVRITSLITGWLLLGAAVAPVCAADAFNTARLREIDAAIEHAIANGETPGAVIWIERDGVVYHRAYGSRSIAPTREPATEDTIYDVASLTKAIATAPSVWLLIERGEIGLDDPAKKYL